MADDKTDAQRKPTPAAVPARPSPPKPTAVPAKPSAQSKPTAKAPAPAEVLQGPVSIAHAAPPVPNAEANPTKWGRIDDDGKVYVKTSDGERQIGVWQAGTPEEGLLHFARRFDDMRTETELLESRLNSRAGNPKQALTSAKHLLESLPDAAVVGDVDALTARLRQVIDHAQQTIDTSKQEKESARRQAIERKHALIDEAEQIAAESTQWKASGDRLKTMLDEWKSIKGVDRKTDDELWKKFSKAREAFNRRRGAHFADLDRQRAGAKQRKEELIAEAEALADSTDWGPTASKFKQLMADWKAAGRAPKDADDALWKRFHEAQETFFSSRSAAFSERDAEFAENAAKKEALLAEADKIDPSSNLKAAKAQLRKLQDQWDQIGKVPRERIRELDGKLKAIQDKVRAAEERKWRRTDPEAQARANQFADKVEHFEQQAAKARAAGDEKKAKQAEEQAAQWRVWLETAQKAVADR